MTWGYATVTASENRGDIVNPVVGNGVDDPIAIRIAFCVIETIPLALEISAHCRSPVGRTSGGGRLKSASGEAVRLLARVDCKRTFNGQLSSPGQTVAALSDSSVDSRVFLQSLNREVNKTSHLGAPARTLTVQYMHR